MDAKTYLKISAINLVFLLAGTLIGIAFMAGMSAVHAQTTQAQTKESTPTRDSATVKVDRAPTTPALDPDVEYVTPGVGLGGPVVTNMLLANRIACDRIQVNGFDLLKFNDALLNFLARKGIASPIDIQIIVQAGKADRPLRIKPQ